MLINEKREETASGIEFYYHLELFNGVFPRQLLSTAVQYIITITITRNFLAIHSISSLERSHMTQADKRLTYLLHFYLRLTARFSS